MDYINSIISENLKSLREQRKMSLDAVSKVSGVSKSMLGQIERGEVNPTVSTVCKIASGLKISFTELVNEPETEHEVVTLDSIKPFLEDDGHYRNFPVFPFDSERRFEIFYIELDRSSHLEADPHPDGAQEFITVFSGELTIHINNEILTAGSGDSIHFKADCPHQYQNTGKEMCRLSMTIYYPK